MKEAFFRISLTNPQTKFDYMCGGELNQIIENLGEIVDADPSITLVIENIKQIFAANVTFKKEERSQFWTNVFPNGLRANLFYEGPSINDRPAATQSADPLANFLQALLAAKPIPDEGGPTNK